MRILSFDAATKTLAHTITYFDLDFFDISSPLLRRANDLYLLGKYAISDQNAIVDMGIEKVTKLANELERIVETLRSMIVIEYGDVVDLVPGKADKDISTVERIKALKKYIDIKPEMYREIDLVIVEFQMAPNNKSGIISNALMALFADYPLIEIHPSLKNKITLGAGYSYADFSVRYANSYDANKAHALECFLQLETIFESRIGATSKKMRGHIADAFMQSLAYLSRK